MFLQEGLLDEFSLWYRNTRMVERDTIEDRLSQQSRLVSLCLKLETREKLFSLLFVDLFSLRRQLADERFRCGLCVGLGGTEDENRRIRYNLTVS